jgi:hypothetical protein
VAWREHITQAFHIGSKKDVETLLLMLFLDDKALRASEISTMALKNVSKRLPQDAKDSHSRSLREMYKNGTVAAPILPVDQTRRCRKQGGRLV